MAYEFVPLSKDTEEDSKPYSFVPLESIQESKPAPVRQAAEPVATSDAMGADFGSAIMAAAEPKRTSVLEGTTLPPQEPIIDRRGAPVSEDKFKELKSKYDAANPKERQALLQSKGFEGSVFQAIDKQYRELDAKQSPTLRIFDTRREARRDAYISQGLNGESADALAARDAATGAEPQRLAQAKPSTFDFATREEYKRPEGKMVLDETGGLLGARTVQPTGFEQLVAAGKAVGGKVTGTFQSASAGAWQLIGDTLESAGDLAGSKQLADVGSRLSSGNAIQQKEAKAKLQAIGENPNAALNFIETGVAGAINNFAPYLVNPALGLTAAVAQTVADEYGNGKAAGQSMSQALPRAAFMGVAEWVGERASLPAPFMKGFKDLVKGVPADEIMPVFARYLVKENLAEQVTTAMQFGTDKWAPFGLTPNSSLDDYLKAVGDTFYQTTAQTLVMGGAGRVAAPIARKLQEVSPERQIANEIDRAVAGTEFTGGDALARRLLDVQSYDANIISPTQTTNLQVAQQAFQTATNADDVANAAGVMAGSLDELLVPGNALTPLPPVNEPTLTNAPIDLGIEPGGRLEPGLTGSELATPIGGQLGDRVEPFLAAPTTPTPVSTELPPVNAQTEQQYGLDKLRLNTPRPQRIQGEPVANLTDDQLTTIASDETAPAITRRSAAVELTARQGEQTAPGAAIETPARAEAVQATAPAVEAPVESRTLTQTELGQMRLGDRRTLAREFDQTENPDGSVTFTRKPTAAAPAAQTNATPVAETFIAIPDATPGVQAVSDAAAPTVAGVPDAPRARAAAQTSLDQWAAANGVVAPRLNAPAPEQETAVNDIANALGSQFGGKVVAFTDTSPTAPNGFAIGGTAFVNTATDVNVMRTSLHEFKHTVEQIAAAETAAGQTDTPAQKFTASIDSVFDDMTPEGKRAYVENFLHADELAGIADPVAREQRVQALLTSDNLKSEMTADFLGNRATDKRFWASVAKADPQGFKGFVDKWVGVIDNLLNTLRGNANQKTKESAKVDSYIRDLNKAKMVARDALVAYRNGTLQQVATTAPAFSQVQGETNEQRINVTAGSQIAPAGPGTAGQVLGAGGGGPAPSYGTARQGAVSVVGRHYSTAPRQILSGAYYGRGLKGAERNRLDSSPDPRLKNRIYFYVDEGAGVRSEAGVGGIAHEVNLQNIYDPKTRLIKPQADANAFESAVINAGFDGYIAPFGNNQSAVVLLGMKHKAVPVRALGQVPSAPAPQAAAPTKLTKGLLSREANAIDVSKIPGAQVRMGNLEIPAEQSEAANTELARIGSDVRFSKKEVPEDIDSFARLENIIPRAREGSYNTNRELKVDLQTAITNAAKQAKIDLAAQNAQTEKYLVRVGVADAMYAIQSNANAVGWYDKTVTKALKILGKIHPEIDTDPNAKFAFTWALAVTSNGLKVDKNFELAERAYKAYKTSGKMPTNIQGGQAQKAINDGLGLFNTMVDQYGIDSVRKFMDSKFAVSQIKRATGLEVTGEFADTQVRGAAVLGPKIGNGFYSNLNGFFDQLTMDRWLMRTWGRWTGTLIESRPDMVKAKRQELRDLVVKMKQNAPAAAEFQKALGTKLNVGDLDGLAAAIQKASMDPATREQFNKTATGESLRKTGNALAKYLDGQKEAPAGPEERNFIRKVFGQILTEVQKDHPALTMSDLQALLWYPEKRLYDIAKADESANKEEGYSDDEAPDYANAAAKLARSIGVSDANIQSAVADAEKDYENRVSAGRTGPSTGAGAQAGAAPGVRGFNQREGRSFLTTGVIDRIRSAGAGDEGQPNSYTRKSGGDGSGLRVLGVPSVAIYSPATTFKNALGEIPIAAPKFFEVGANGAAAFRNSIQAAKDSSPFGAAVYVYDQADYEGMRLFLTEDGKAGFALKGDDIVSVFAGESQKGAVNSILQLATQEGGRRLDAFDTVLPNLYGVHGFRAVARTKWNDEYSPDGWDKETFKEFNNGEPDVVFMVHDPKYFGKYTKADGDVIAEYDDGAKAQAEALADIKQVRQTDKPKPANPATIFANLDKRGLARTKGEAALKDHPNAARIQFVQDNFLDILSELDDAGTVKINCD